MKEDGRKDFTVKTHKTEKRKEKWQKKTRGKKISRKGLWIMASRKKKCSERNKKKLVTLVV